jgi:hypothetical protein
MRLALSLLFFLLPLSVQGTHPCVPTCAAGHFALVSNCSVCLPLQCPVATELQRGHRALICMPAPVQCTQACPATLVRERHTCSCIRLHAVAAGLLWGKDATGEGPYYYYYPSTTSTF